MLFLLFVYVKALCIALLALSLLQVDSISRIRHSTVQVAIPGYIPSDRVRFLHPLQYARDDSLEKSIDAGTGHDNARPKLELKDDDLTPLVSIRSYDDLEDERRRKVIALLNPTSSPTILNEAQADYDSRRVKGVKRASTTSGVASAEKSSRTFGSLSLEELVNIRREDRPPPTGLIERKDDLNGIKPQTPFIFATVPALMSYGSWRIASYLAAHFAVQFVESDIYPVQRMAVVSRNVVVGVFTPSAGFAGAICVGLLALGCAVVLGVAKGELDPTAKKDGLVGVEEDQQGQDSKDRGKNPFITRS